MGVWIEISIDIFLLKTIPVTPCVGVWIEIINEDRFVRSSIAVTPCVGVWIEIFVRKVWYNNKAVTPCVGVWIEIYLTFEVDL